MVSTLSHLARGDATVDVFSYAVTGLHQAQQLHWLACAGCVAGPRLHSQKCAPRRAASAEYPDKCWE